MYTTPEILNILKTKKAELEKKYPISEMALFGSYASGNYNKDSDIDILVDFNGRIDAFDYIRIAHALEDGFNVKIDLVSRKAVKPAYLPFVEKNMIHV